MRVTTRRLHEFENITIQMPVIRDLYKMLVAPLIFTGKGILEGAYRGISGENSPVDYTKLDIRFPTNEYTEYFEGYDGCSGYDVTYKIRHADTPAEFGKLLAMAGETITASIPWGFTRGLRTIVIDFPRRQRYKWLCRKNNFL